MSNSLSGVEAEREKLEEILNRLIAKIGKIRIADPKIMPYGWRKAAKGRTVWRIVEEIISQNLEYYQEELGFDSVVPAESEVGVYDFSFCIGGSSKSFVNIKSAVSGGRKNKDDISKAEKLIDFYGENPSANLYVATFIIRFDEDITIGLEKCIVFPTAWIPDIYINPSNNGNLQSSNYKNLSAAVKRTPQAFLECLLQESKIADAKRTKKKNKKG